MTSRWETCRRHQEKPQICNGDMAAERWVQRNHAPEAFQVQAALLQLPQQLHGECALKLPQGVLVRPQATLKALRAWAEGAIISC